MAEVDPTVLVVEDLHWADPAMLDFLEHLADRALGVPLLIVATTAPSSSNCGPRCAGPAQCDDGSPWTRSRMTRRSGSCRPARGRPIDAGLRDEILARSGGDPLYAEGFVQLLLERGVLTAVRTGLELRPRRRSRFPDSVDALIAASSTRSPPDQKALLADASVVGDGLLRQRGHRRSGDRSPSRRRSKPLHELARNISSCARGAGRASRGSRSSASATYWPVIWPTLRSTGGPAARRVAVARWIKSNARRADSRTSPSYPPTALDRARAGPLRRRRRGVEHTSALFAHRAPDDGGDPALGLDTSAPS